MGLVGGKADRMQYYRCGIDWGSRGIACPTDVTLWEKKEILEFLNLNEVKTHHITFEFV